MEQWKMGDIMKLIGVPTDKECPKCGSHTVQNQLATTWCINEGCCWSNDDELSRFIKELNDGYKQVSSGEENNE